MESPKDKKTKIADQKGTTKWKIARYIKMYTKKAHQIASHKLEKFHQKVD